VWQDGAQGEFLMPEIVGGGAGLLDYDGDGDLDIYFVQGGDLRGAWAGANTDGNRLYRNDGHMQFTDVTEETGAAGQGYGMGLAIGDVDTDGDPDIYLSNVGPNVLLRNDGGTFVDVTEVSGTGDAGWGASAAFIDGDLDGDLDLFVTNYLDWNPDTEITCYSPLGGEDYCSPRNYLSPARDVYFRNRGDGMFENATKQAGFDAAEGTGLGVTHADWNGDGRPDLFVANDGMRDLLWISAADGTWDERGMERGCSLDDEGIAKAGMGVDTTDIDDDGDFDIIVCNLKGESDSIFRNDGRYFVDITGRTGVRPQTKHATRFGLGWEDFNNDGWLDLYEANGAVTRLAAPETDDPYAQQNFVLEGRPDGRYAMVSPSGGTRDQITLTSRAAAFGDLDGDGGTDIVVVNRQAPANIYRNIHPARGRWIELDVRDASGRPAIGATVTATLGGRKITRQTQRAGSYLASSDPAIHIGLGSEAHLKGIQVTWPKGHHRALGTLQGGARYRVTPTGTVGADVPQK